MQTVKDGLIDAGVKNLHEFGYPDCNATNILTDRIYAAFFKGMLEENLGHGAADAQIKELLVAVSANQDADSEAVD